MKPEARIFELASPTKKISLNFHLNKFSQFEYFFLGRENVILSPNCCSLTSFEYSSMSRCYLAVCPF